MQQSHPSSSSSNPTTTNNNNQQSDQIPFARPKGISDQVYYMLIHPVYRKYGEPTYNSHAFIEKMLGLASCEASLKINPHLKLITSSASSAEGSFLWTVDTLKQHIMEYIGSKDKDQGFKYLLEIYKKLSTYPGTAPLIPEDLQRIIQEILLLIIGHVRLNPGTKKANDLDLFKESYFLDNVLPHLQEKTLKDIMNPLFENTFTQSSKLDLIKYRDLLEEINLLEALLTKDKRIVQIFVSHPHYMPAPKDPNFDKKTFFGVFLSLTAFPDEFPMKKFFMDNIAGMLDPQKIQKHLRERIHMIIDGVVRVMKIIMKADPKSKQSFTDWLYLTLEGYKIRFKTQNIIPINKGNFMNYLLVLLKFCQDPFKDPLTFPNWLGRIDIKYLQQKPIFQNESLLNGLSNQYQPSQDPKYSFFTELVFITSQALQLYQRLTYEFDRITQILRLQCDTRSKVKLECYTGRFGFEVHMDDPYLLEQILKLIAFSALFVLNSFDIPITNLSELAEIFPKTKHINRKDFQQRPCLPIYWVDNIIELMQFTKNADRGLLLRNPHCLKILMNFLLCIIPNSQWIPAPHIRSQAVNIIHDFILLKEDTPAKQFAAVFSSNPYYAKEIIPSLIQLFIDMERTVGKHSIRLECCQLLEFILKEKSLAEQNLNTFTRLHQEIPDQLLKFGMLYVGDLAYLLDEALQRMEKIFTNQSSQLSLEEEENYIINIETVISYLMTFQTYYEMGSWLTKFPVDFLLSSEVQDLFTGQLNHTLKVIFTSFLGKLGQIIQFGFDPINLLKTIIQIFLNLHKKDGFLESIVSDTRNFDIKLFVKVSNICDRYDIIDDYELLDWQGITSKVQEKRKGKEEADKLLSQIEDLPEEFLDPLVNEVMKDPVMLPASKVIMDRTTISKHLLNNPVDPFTRTELTKEMLIPVPDLQGKIQEYFKSKEKV